MFCSGKENGAYVADALIRAFDCLGVRLINRIIVDIGGGEHDHAGSFDRDFKTKAHAKDIPKRHSL